MILCSSRPFRASKALVEVFYGVEPIEGLHAYLTVRTGREPPCISQFLSLLSSTPREGPAWQSKAVALGIGIRIHQPSRLHQVSLLLVYLPVGSPTILVKGSRPDTGSNVQAIRTLSVSSKQDCLWIVICPGQALLFEKPKVRPQACFSSSKVSFHGLG
jgi:hypothetical protein